MYPNGPISHERHHFLFFREVEQLLWADEESDDDADDADDANDDDNTSVKINPFIKTNNVGEKEEDDNDDEFYLPPSTNLPTASEICANASYYDRNTKNTNGTTKNAVANLIKATLFHQSRRQTDETVGLDDDDEGFYDDEEEILRQVYRHDSLVHRMSSSLNRRLSDCMQNLALETSQRDGLSSATQHQNNKNDKNIDDSIEYIDFQEDEEIYLKVGECFEMDVFANHRAPMGNNSMDSITTAPTSNTDNNNKSHPTRRKSETSTDAINDALLRVLEESSSSGCKLSDDDLVPAEVQIGDAARRVGHRYSRRRSFTNAYAA